jgi:F0F1-type ATP synthase alpha subunit
MVIDGFGHIGLVLNLEYHLTGIVMFTEDRLVAGDLIIRLFNTLSTTVNPFMLGNVFNPLGKFLNSINKLSNISFKNIINELGQMIRNVELKAPGIIVREPVYEPLFTGFIGVDGLLPLGQGQRELIIGDRQTGKTAIAIDAILNQSNLDILNNRYS